MGFWEHFKLPVGVSQALTRMSEQLQHLEQMQQEIGQRVMSSVNQEITTACQNIPNMAVSLEELKKQQQQSSNVSLQQVKELQTQLAQVVSLLGQLQRKQEDTAAHTHATLEAVHQGLQPLHAGLSQTQEACQTALQATMTHLQAELAALRTEQQEQLTTLQQPLIQAHERTNTRLEELRNVHQQAAAYMASLQSSQENTAERLESLQSGQQETTERLAHLQSNQQETSAQLANLQTSQQESLTQIQQLSTSWQQQQQEFNQSLAALQENLKGHTERVEQHWQNLPSQFDQVLGQRLDSLQQALTQMAGQSQEQFQQLQQLLTQWQTQLQENSQKQLAPLTQTCANMEAKLTALETWVTESTAAQTNSMEQLVSKLAMLPTELAEQLHQEQMAREINRMGKTLFKTTHSMETSQQLIKSGFENLKQQLDEQTRALSQLYQQKGSAQEELQIKLPQLFPVLDSLDANIEAGQEALKHPLSLWQRIKGMDAEVLKSWLKGVTLLRERLLALLSEYQVQPIPTVGHQFDPQLHHALGTAQGPHNQIIQEISKGYRRGDQILRYAQVIVGKEE